MLQNVDVDMCGPGIDIKELGVRSEFKRIAAIAYATQITPPQRPLVAGLRTQRRRTRIRRGSGILLRFAHHEEKPFQGRFVAKLRHKLRVDIDADSTRSTKRLERDDARSAVAAADVPHNRGRSNVRGAKNIGNAAVGRVHKGPKRVPVKLKPITKIIHSSFQRKNNESAKKNRVGEKMKKRNKRLLKKKTIFGNRR